MMFAEVEGWGELVFLTLHLHLILRCLLSSA